MDDHLTDYSREMLPKLAAESKRFDRKCPIYGKCPHKPFNCSTCKWQFKDGYK